MRTIHRDGRRYTLLDQQEPCGESTNKNVQSTKIVSSVSIIAEKLCYYINTEFEAATLSLLFYSLLRNSIINYTNLISR